MTPTWALVPCAIAGAGLGYLASMRCRRAAVRTLSSDRGDGKYVLSETPHPLWVPGQKQPPAEGLENGARHYECFQVEYEHAQLRG